MRHAVLIYNPMAGRRRMAKWLPPVLDTLRRGGFEVEPVATRQVGHATELAREAVADSRIEVAFAMGGDGTLREVARGLLGSEVALGPLPAGTTNVLVLALDLPTRALAAARVLPSCEPRAIDVGMAGDEPFLMLLSGGLDAKVMEVQNFETKSRFGKAAVGWTSLQQWWIYDYPEIELRLDGHSECVSQFVASNIPFYAGAFTMAPGADMEDRLLNLVTFRGSGRLATLGFMRDLALGRHLKRADVEMRLIEEVEVVGPAEYLVELDGDVLTGPSPLKISVSKQRLWVLAPPR